MIKSTIINPSSWEKDLNNKNTYKAITELKGSGHFRQETVTYCDCGSLRCNADMYST